MYDVILRRNGNYFTKKIYENICGKDSLKRDLKADIITSASSGLYKGTQSPSDNFKQWIKSYQLFNESNIGERENITLTEAKKLNINIEKAVTSGYVLLTKKGLIKDTHANRPSIPLEDSFNYDSKILFRHVNELNDRILKALSKRIDIYTPRNIEPLYDFLTYENSSLIGLPYIMLDNLYNGKVEYYYLREEYLTAIVELLISGHVYIKDNKIFLDKKDIKKEKFLEWKGKAIYCRKVK